jgi:Recombinase
LLHRLDQLLQHEFLCFSTKAFALLELISIVSRYYLSWTMTLYSKRKAGFHNMRPERARALSCRGTRTLVELANDYAHTYAPFIQAAVREVGHNYRQVAKWLTRERIPAQRAGQWKAQSVKNLVVRYRRLTGRRILIPYKRFPTPAPR